MSDEIDLSQFVSVFIKRKRLFGIFLLVGIVIASAYSILKVKPTYTAISLVSAHDQSNENNISVTKDLTTFAAQTLSDSEIQKISLSISGLFNVPIQDIKNSIVITSSRDSNLLTIKTNYANAAYAKDLANAAAELTAANIEISARMERVRLGNLKVTETEEKILVTTKEIEEAKKQMEFVPEKQNTKKSLIEDPYLFSLINNSSVASLDKSSLLELNSENINPVYNSISSKLAEASIELSKLQAELQSIKDRIKLDYSVILAKQTILTSKDDKQAVDSLTTINITSAIEPKFSNSNRILIFSFIVILFIFAGIVAIFFKEYWVKAKS